MKVVHCECGTATHAGSDDELASNLGMAHDH